MKTPHEILQQYWGYTAFRSLQEDIIQNVLNQKDTLALLPTGGGKSLCFQVPGMVMEGMTLVVSPLIALMKDQVENLQKRNIAATYINSSLSAHQIDIRLQGAMDGKYKFLYLAPERLLTQVFLQRLPAMKINLLVADEAHCISQWGFDFRPSYLDIYRIREIHPHIPVIALTASAVQEAQDDIVKHLKMKEVAVFRKSFYRENLRYFVYEDENVSTRIKEVLQRTQGAGIVYARTRKATEEMALWLQNHQISAIAYHGGLTHAQRDEIQQTWIDNKYRIVVATNAFGMGIDKPDVRLVLHLHLPLDIESYYQEAGRVGRDGKTGIAIAFSQPADIAEAQRWVKEKYPEWEQVQAYFQLLCNVFQIPEAGDINKSIPFDLQQFAQTHKASARTLLSVIGLLHRENIVFFKEEKEDYGYLQAMVHPDDWRLFYTQTPAYARIMEMILRNMGGAVFSREVGFIPQSWADALKINIEELEKQLAYLVQCKLLVYTAPSHHPTLTFLRPRNFLTKRNLNWEKYTFLRQRSEARFQAFLGYIQNKTQCRSLIIQQYFGEKADKTCGKCDVCIGRYKQTSTLSEWDTHQQAILAFIAAHPDTPYREVIQKVTVGSPAQKEAVIRYLLDKEILKSSIRGNLSINPKK